MMGLLTLLNAVLLGTLVVLVLLLPGHTLDALIVVVLVGGALGGLGALWTLGLVKGSIGLIAIRRWVRKMSMAQERNDRKTGYPRVSGH